MICIPKTPFLLDRCVFNVTLEYTRTTSNGTRFLSLDNCHKYHNAQLSTFPELGINSNQPIKQLISRSHTGKMIGLTQLIATNHQSIRSLLTSSSQLYNKFTFPTQSLCLLQLLDISYWNLEQNRTLLPALDTQIIQPRGLIGGEV